MAEGRATSREVNGRDILARLQGLEISTWSYEWEPEVRHLGPMSQDFMAAFGLGDDETRINLIDANGVNMIAIQALARRIEALEREVAELRGERGSDVGSQVDRDPT